MDKRPSISVVIPVYNGAEFLAEALDSVFAQSYLPLEVIVADDGSTDDSLSIARSFPGVTCLSLEHCGVSSARNAGVRASRGEWLAFLDADDRWLPGKLQAQVAASLKDPSAGLIFTCRAYVFTEGVPSWFRGPGPGVIEAAFEPSSWLVRRVVFEFVGGFDVSRQLGEDMEWLSRARDLAVKELVVPGLFVERRIHATNASGAVNHGKVVLEIVRESVVRKRRSQEESL